MNESTAKALAALVRWEANYRRNRAIDVAACAWAGGMWGIEVTTSTTTADGRTSIRLYVGSDDLDVLMAVYGDEIRGHYTDDPHYAHVIAGTLHDTSYSGRYSDVAVRVVDMAFVDTFPAYVDAAMRDMVG